MKFNKEQALEVAETIVPLFENNEKPFDIQSCESILPEGMEPKSLGHRLFLFLTAPGNYAVDSETYYEHARKMFVSSPDYFDPDYIKKEFSVAVDRWCVLKKIDNGTEITVSDKFADVIKNNLGGRSRELARRWWANSVELEKYGYDPKNIFGEDDTVESAFKKLNGYRDKKTKVQHGFRAMKKK